MDIPPVHLPDSFQPTTLQNYKPDYSKGTFEAQTQKEECP